MAKTKKTKRSAADLSDMADGFAEGVTEQLVVEQFKSVWKQLSAMDKARANLCIAALGAFGDSMVWLRDSFEGFKKGKMPKMDAAKLAIPQLEQAAIAYVAATTLTAKSKKTAKKRK